MIPPNNMLDRQNSSHTRDPAWRDATTIQLAPKKASRCEEAATGKGKGGVLQMIGTSVVVRGPPLVHCCSFCHSAPTCYWHCHSGLMIVTINGKGMETTGCCCVHNEDTHGNMHTGR